MGELSDETLERICLETWGGEFTWFQRWESKVFDPWGHDYFETRVSGLWGGPHPGYPCPYCSGEMVFERWEAPRPVPQGARDLGLKDPAYGWVCPNCGNALGARWVSDRGRPCFRFHLPGTPSGFGHPLPVCDVCGETFAKGSKCFARVQTTWASHWADRYAASRGGAITNYQEQQDRGMFPFLPETGSVPQYEGGWFDPHCLPRDMASPPPLPEGAVNGRKTGCGPTLLMGVAVGPLLFLRCMTIVSRRLADIVSRAY
jgi:hypothetical protein